MASPDSAIRPRYAWISDADDPTLHASIEEECLRDSDRDYFLLYINRPSVHVGKNQNLWAQIAAKAVFDSPTTLHRRITGGGAVYHDHGNLNFALISTGEPRVDFCRHLHFLLPYFKRREVPVEIRNRSDLFHGDRKFSGNAEYFSGRRILHHGTLLFNSDLQRLHSVLAPQSAAYKDRSIDSNRNRTVNLSSLLPDIPDTSEFARDFLRVLLDIHSELTPLDSPPVELSNAKNKYSRRYESLEWVFGRSPKYELERRVSSKIGELSSHIAVREGQIVSADLRCSSSEVEEDLQEFSALLNNKVHEPVTVWKYIENKEWNESLRSSLAAHWLDLFF